MVSSTCAGSCWVFGRRNRARSMDVKQKAPETEAVEWKAKEDSVVFLGVDHQRLLGSPHDIPILGVVSSSVVDAFSGLVSAHATEEELRAVFDKIDTSKSSSLDKTEIAQACRELGKSERQIQKMIDYLPPGDVQLSFEDFQELVCPGPRPALNNADIMGIQVPYPNAEKIYDIPVLGNAIYMTNDMIAQPCDNMLRSGFRSSLEYDDLNMERTFMKYDPKHTHHISKKNAAKALRAWGHTEAEIKVCLDSTCKEQLTLLEFKDMVRGGPKYRPSRLNYVPGAGAAIDSNILPGEDYSQDDLQERWEFIREINGFPEKLDKFEVSEVLRLLGKPEFQIQEFIDSMEDEEMEFKEFDNVFHGKPRPYLTEIGGVTVPNLAKVHDVPLLGTATKLTQDVCVDSYDWTVGACLRNFSKMPEREAREKFDEYDKDPKNGKLSKKEIHRLMRHLGKKEWEIKRVHDAMPQDEYTFAELRGLLNVQA